MEDGSIVVDLPSLGTQHVIILTVLCFHCQDIFGKRFTTTDNSVLEMRNEITSSGVDLKKKKKTLGEKNHYS